MVAICTSEDYELAETMSAIAELADAADAVELRRCQVLSGGTR